LRVFAFEPPEIALRAVRQLPEDFRLIRTLLEAQCLLSLDREAAIPLLKHLWTKLPWHPNLVFKLHSLLAPPHGPAQPGPDTAVLLYSWNNADLLETTLQSLARSDLGGAVVMILDNGSTDHTPAVVREAASLFGDRLKRLRIPVNIGAPAARNWLLSHPETQPFRTVVFLDDDVLLPAQWLTELSARHRQAPTGSIVGCRIMDQTPRKSVQTADVNLLEIEDDGDFLIANSGGGELDLGLHDYNRPCLSVTGCCHMMDRERALELGGFDLRFNPSQFDDFDLDLRNALAGGQAFYAGGTGIMHCQRSSLSQADSEAKRGHIQGNMLKLNTKYTPQQKAELLRRNREMLWDDLLAKTRDLENL
jgi:GT2 family glycosyltransferase